MARIRTIKPEMFQDEKLAPLDVVTRFVFLGLIAMADDAGRLLDNVRIVDAFVFPETDESSREALARLSGIGRIRRGTTASGQRIIEIVNWSRHQRVDHPNLKSALPEIVTLQEVPPSPEPLARDSREIPEPLAHHTNDQRPTTSDLRPSVPVGSRSKAARTPKAEVLSRFPDFPESDRQALFAYWQAKVGTVNFGRLVNAVGPHWRVGADLDRVACAVRDYCGIVTRGRGALYASPEDMGKRLGALIENATTHRMDSASRMEGADRIVHGRVAA